MTMPTPYGDPRRHTSPWRRTYTSPQRRTRWDDLEPGGRCAETAFLATLRDMTNIQSLPAQLDAP
ncbi:MAG TPA: hypothetical protein VI030_02890, partial [Propionibacteriaceae bacterium]